MKIYLFNPENGCYLGEDFADEGVCRVPPDATTVAPPRHEPGQVPVFDLVKKVWKIELSAALRDAFAAPAAPRSAASNG